MTAPESTTSKRRILAREREVQAMSLRLAGAGYKRIGEALGVSTAAAYKAVKRVMDRTRKVADETAEQLREVHRARLEALHLANWPQAQKGHLGAGALVVKISESLRKLDGVDAPAKMDLTTKGEKLVVTIVGQDPDADDGRPAS